MTMGVVRPCSGLTAFLAGAVAGGCAGAAYLATAGIDNRVSGRRLYDLLLLGRPFSRTSRKANAFGLLVHLGNSLALGAVYGLVAEKRLPGPPVVNGVVFAVIEGTVLYPVLALEQYHPARKTNEIGPYWSFRSYLWNLPRHVAYGALLGWLYPRLRDR